MSIWLQLAIFTTMVWVLYEIWKKMIIRIWELTIAYKRLEQLKKELEELVGARIELNINPKNKK